MTTTARKTLKRFTKDEDGAVTTDWVVMAAAACSLALFVVWQVAGSTDIAAAKINTGLEFVADEALPS